FTRPRPIAVVGAAPPSPSAADLVEGGLFGFPFPAGVPFLHMRLDARQLIGARTTFRRQAFLAETADLAKQQWPVDCRDDVVFNANPAADDDSVDIRPHRSLHESVDRIDAGIDPRITLDPLGIDQNGVTFPPG